MLQLLHVILIVALLGCPLWCQAGYCCHAPEQAIGSPKCKCCPQRSCPEAPAEQNPPQHSHGQCQGICGGAVLEKAVEPAGGTLGLMQPLLPCAAGQPEKILTPLDSRHRLRVLSGRMLRHLHQSLLC